MSKEVTKTALVFMLVGLISGMIIGYGAGVTKRERAERKAVVDTVIHVDTLTYRAAIYKDSTILRYETRLLPVSRAEASVTAPLIEGNDGENVPPLTLSVESDSVAVEIPISQKRFEGEEYTAWVSGYEPSLDSIQIFRPVTTITITEKPPNKPWGVGIQLGYGVTPAGKLAPFIGVGLSYSIWRF